MARAAGGSKAKMHTDELAENINRQFQLVARVLTCHLALEFNSASSTAA